VIYDGRAYSVLEEGNYLILYKGDGSIQIHGGTKIQPRNYQGAKSTLEQRGHLLICRNKKETITIVVHKVIEVTYLRFWSEAEIDIQRTEQELVHKIFTNWGDYIDGEFEIIEKEYPTKYGPVDLVGFGEEIIAVVEVKRRKATISDCTQLRKYVEAFEASNVMGYLAAPQIGDNAAKWLDEHGYKWIRVTFDSVHE
jgi:hypothetical protein